MVGFETYFTIRVCRCFEFWHYSHYLGQSSFSNEIGTQIFLSVHLLKWILVAYGGLYAFSHCFTGGISVHRPRLGNAQGAPLPHRPEIYEYSPDASEPDTGAARAARLQKDVRKRHRDQGRSRLPETNSLHKWPAANCDLLLPRTAKPAGPYPFPPEIV